MLSSVLNGLLAWVMLASAKVHRSIALEADARHLLTDVWTSAGVLVGLMAMMLTGWLWLDAAAAIGVALNILWEGAHLIRRSTQGLMDQAIEPDARQAIQKTLAQFELESLRFDHIITRQSGQRRLSTCTCMHQPTGHWDRPAAIRSRVEASLMRAVPGLRASISCPAMSRRSLMI